MTIMNARSEPTPLSRPWIAGSVSLRVAAAFPYRRKASSPDATSQPVIPLPGIVASLDPPWAGRDSRRPARGGH